MQPPGISSNPWQGHVGISVQQPVEATILSPLSGDSTQIHQYRFQALRWGLEEADIRGCVQSGPLAGPDTPKLSALLGVGTETLTASHLCRVGCNLSWVESKTSADVQIWLQIQDSPCPPGSQYQSCPLHHKYPPAQRSRSQSCWSYPDCLRQQVTQHQDVAAHIRWSCTSPPPVFASCPPSDHRFGQAQPTSSFYWPSSIQLDHLELDMGQVEQRWEAQLSPAIQNRQDHGTPRGFQLEGNR